MPEETEPEEQTEEKKQLKYAFFRGCNIPTRLPHLEAVSRDVFKALDIELVDLNFGCCPFMGSVRDINDLDWLIMAARNLCLAEELKLPIISLCTGCTQTLVEAKERLEDKETKIKVNEQLAQIGKEYKGTIQVDIFAQVLHEHFDHWKDKITRPLPFKVATHTGCHVLQPSSKIKFDDPHNPKKLDELVRFLGADAVNYDKKVDCCGALGFNMDREASFHILKDKVDSMGEIDCITVLCPTCFSQYDKNQRLEVAKLGGYIKPVLHLMQLVGLAIGMNKEQTMLKHNHSKTLELEHKIDDLIC